MSVLCDEALEGKTPAEACGIKVEGKNKWLTLIQNASKKTWSLQVKRGKRSHWFLKFFGSCYLGIRPLTHIFFHSLHLPQINWTSNFGFITHSNPLSGSMIATCNGPPQLGGPASNVLIPIVVRNIKTAKLIAS